MGLAEFRAEEVHKWWRMGQAESRISNPEFRAAPEFGRAAISNGIKRWADYAYQRRVAARTAAGEQGWRPKARPAPAGRPVKGGAPSGESWQPVKGGATAGASRPPVNGKAGASAVRTNGPLVVQTGLTMIQTQVGAMLAVANQLVHELTAPTTVVACLSTVDGALWEHRPAWGAQGGLAGGKAR
jgi:hypothetical protein